MELVTRKKTINLVFTTRKIVNITNILKEKNFEDLYFKAVNENDLDALAKIIYAFAEDEAGMKSFKTSDEVFEFIDDYKEENNKAYGDIFNSRCNKWWGFFQKPNDKRGNGTENIKSIIRNQYGITNQDISRENNRTIGRKRNIFRGLDGILEQVSNADNTTDLIYSLELLSYFFGLKPSEFWNGRYKDIVNYCQANLIKRNDDLKTQINLNEATTNKLIAGDCMNQNAKSILIRDCYKELF